MLTRRRRPDIDRSGVYSLFNVHYLNVDSLINKTFKGTFSAHSVGHDIENSVLSTIVVYA